MTNKPVEEFVWKEKNYTDEIHSAVRELFRQSKFVTFTYKQIEEQLLAKFPWLVLDTPKRNLLLNKIVITSIRKFIQLGLVKKCKSKLSIDKQWIWSQFINETAYQNVTTENEIAQTEVAINQCLHRALSDKTLKMYNNQPY